MKLRGNPKLSIVTICYNNADGLAMTLDSTLRKQRDYSDYEQIVVDGGSSDATMDVIREYQDRIAWWCSEPDKGIYNAMNKGVEHANGEYLLFLNSGDIIMEGALAKIFANEFDEDIVYSDIYTTNGNERCLVKSPSREELTPAYLTINTLPHQATLIRRELHDAIGGYDESMKISAAPKFILDAVLGKKCTVRYLEMAYSLFDRSGISSDIKRLPDKLREWQYFMRPHFGDKVATAFYKAKIAETFVSRHVIEYISQHPEKIQSVRRLLDSVTYRIKHGLNAQQLKDLDSALRDGNSLLWNKQKGEKPQHDHAESRISNLEAEVASLKRSSAYRVGMLITWPARKLYRIFVSA